jgi:hypothetical protein
LLQERRDAGGRHRARVRGVRARIQAPTQRVGVGGLIEGTDRAQDLPGARIDQIDAAEVPAGIAQMDLLETAIPGGDLEALAVQTHRAVGTALLALDLDAERIA